MAFWLLRFGSPTVQGGSIAPPAPKTEIEVRVHLFGLPGIFGSSSFFEQLLSELTVEFAKKNKGNEAEAKTEALRFVNAMYKFKLLKTIFEAAGADHYDTIFITNKGAATDKNIALHVDGIRFADIEGNYPNVQRENDLIKINIIRPGDKIILSVWTDDALNFGDEPRFRASSIRALLLSQCISLWVGNRNTKQH